MEFFPEGMNGSACFAFLKGARLTQAENDFILRWNGKSQDALTYDDKLRLIRLVYKAFQNEAQNPIAAAGLSTQFVAESAYGTRASGTFNYSGVKEFNAAKPRTLCRTKEMNISQMEIDGFKRAGHYFGSEINRDGSVTYFVADYFKNYGSFDEYLVQKVAFIRDSPTYGKSWFAKKTDDYFQIVAEAGYATAPRYASFLSDVLHTWNRYAYYGQGNSQQIIAETRNDAVVA